MGPHVPDMYKGALAMGQKKAHSSPFQIFTLAIAAGMQIGFGALTALACGGYTPGIKGTDPGLSSLLAGIYGYPFGLFMVVVMGSDLFTSDVGTVALALFERKVRVRELIKSWVLSWVGNFIGVLILAALLTDAESAPTKVVIAMADYKTSHSFHVAFSRGLLCNLLVCTAVFCASAADSLPGKFISVLGPISMFVSLSFDHSVANMFILSFARMLGSDLTIGTMFVKNLIPVTLGNIVGGGVFVAFLSFAGFGDLPAVLTNRLPLSLPSFHTHDISRDKNTIQVEDTEVPATHATTLTVMPRSA